jgi:TonB family protein
MSSLHEPVHQSLQLLAIPLSHHLIAATVILLAALLVSRWAPRISGRSRSLILLAGSASLLFPAQLLAPAVRLLGLDGLFAKVHLAEAPGLVEIDLGGAGALASSPAQPDETFCLLAAIWLIGTMFLVLSWIGRSRRARAELSGSTLLPTARETEMFAAAAKDAGSRASLIRSGSALGPAVTGIVRPQVVLPAQLAATLDDDELRAVLVHELSHVARRDNLLSLAQSALCAIFWFHPLVWLAASRSRVERERACDERTIEILGDPVTYFSAIIKACRHAAAPRLAGISCMGGNLENRSRHLMSYFANRNRYISHRLIATATLSILAVSTLAAATLITDPAEVTAPSSSSTIYALEVEHEPDGDAHTFSITVTERASGEILSAPRIVTQAGVPASARTGRQAPDGTGYDIHVELQPVGEDEVEVAVTVSSSDGALLERQERRVSTAASSLPSSAEPIDLTLQNAQLADVVRTFGALTGHDIDASVPLRGLVTITLQQEPWDRALARVLAPRGYSYRIADGTIYIRASRKSPFQGERAGGSVTGPKMISSVAPNYPAEARKSRLEGRVIIEALIDERGLVEDARVVEGLPLGLSEAALDAVMQWVYSPALKEGVPTRVIYLITINFKLSDTE